MPNSFYKLLSIIDLLLLCCSCVHCLTCSEVIDAGTGSKFSEDELSTLTYNGDLASCLVWLGKDQLTQSQAQVLWQVLIKTHGSVEEIPEESLRLLGWIKLGIPVDHFGNISFNDVDTIAAFGQYSGMSLEQLSALRNAIGEQWSYKTIEDYTSYDLAALKHVLCVFNATEISLIHPDSYRDAAAALGSLKNCSEEVIAALAGLAVDQRAFGSPRRWTSTQISAVGCIIAGLPNLGEIPPEAIEGLTAAIVSCLPPSVLQSFSEEQLAMIPSVAAIAISEEQRAAFTRRQLVALNLAIDDENKNNGDSLAIYYILFFVIIVFKFVSFS